MPKPSQYIEDVNMRNASNGVIISYCIRVKNAKSTYEDYSYNRKDEVFEFNDEDGESEAWDRFKELFTQSRKDDKLMKGGDSPALKSY